MAVGVGTSTALLLTAAKMQKRKYDESKIHSQHTNHNYFAKLFESDKKRFCGPQYFHIAKYDRQPPLPWTPPHPRVPLTCSLTRLSSALLHSWP